MTDEQELQDIHLMVDLGLPPDEIDYYRRRNCPFMRKNDDDDVESEQLESRRSWDGLLLEEGLPVYAKDGGDLVILPREKSRFISKSKMQRCGFHLNWMFAFCTALLLGAMCDQVDTIPRILARVYCACIACKGYQWQTAQIVADKNVLLPHFQCHLANHLYVWSDEHARPCQGCMTCFLTFRQTWPSACLNNRGFY